MKVLKKIAGALTALSLLLPCIALADGDGKEHGMLTIPDTFVTEDYALMNSPIMTDSEQELFEYIMDTMSETHSDMIEIDTDKYQLSLERFQELGWSLVSLMQYEHPEIYYVKHENSMFYIGYTYDPVTHIISSINPVFVYTKEEIDAIDTEIENAAEFLIADITPDMSDIQKIYIVHDAIAANYEYDISLNYRTLDKMVLSHTGVCQSYAYLFKYVMDKIGIECVTVPSNMCDHMWNKVKVDGEWYNIDITYDDPLPNRSSNISHKCFLVNDAEIASIDPSLHGGWNAQKWNMEPVEESQSTRFSNSALREVWGSSATVGNTTYCFSKQNDICKIIFDENVLREDYTLLRDYKWFQYGDNKAYYADSKTMMTSYYSVLAKYNGKLYFNSPDKIYRYDLGENGTQGKAVEVYKYDGSDISNTYFYGLIVKEDGLYAEYTTNNAVGVEALVPVTIAEDNPTSSPKPDNPPADPERPTFSEPPCEANTTVETVTNTDTGETVAEVKIEIEIPEVVTVTLKEKPLVKVAKYNADGVFIGFENVELDEGGSASFTADSDCHTVKTFIWSSYFMPLANTSSVTIK